MIMPFIRLIAIYVVVALVVLLVFNRSSVMALMGIVGDGAPVAYSDPSLPPIPAPASSVSDVPSTQAVADDAVVTPLVSRGANTPEAGATPTPNAAPNAAAQTPVYASDDPDPTGEATVPATVQIAAATPPAEPVQVPQIAPQIAPQTTSVAPTASDIDPNTGLDAARKAYWDGKTDESIALYQSLIAAHPDSMDFAGELGNIYFSAGRYDQAAPYYKRVAEALLSGGQPAQAQAMIAVLQSIAPDMAAELQTAAAKHN